MNDDQHNAMLEREDALREQAEAEGLDPDEIDLDQYEEDLEEDAFEPPEPDDPGYGRYDTW